MVEEFNEIIGKVFTSVERVDDNEIIFSNATEKYCLKHWQDCCENVHSRLALKYGVSPTTIVRRLKTTYMS